ncbi:MAG: peptidoglycan-binding protein, partial [Clostridia bacterium]|nr:peptidoglycan-binding protein [Clostridia bacterium]
APADASVRLDALARGDKGSAVRNLQLTLIDLGYLASGADGDFGGKTEAAVQAAQRQAGLSATGVADGAFLAALYAGQIPNAQGAYVQLAPRVIRYDATSQHRDKYGSYTVANAFDGNTATTWAESGAGYGIGEGITFTVATFGRASFTLDIWAGYHKSKSTYYNNGRPRDITLTINGVAYRYTLEDVRASQSIVISDFGGGAFVDMGIYIESVYQGSRWQDTCICEIQVS